MKLPRFTTANLQAFTLVETLVSVFVVTMVIVGPLTVASNASLYARLTKDTMTATYLAQEAVELLRHQQDSVYIRCATRNATQCIMSSSELPNEAAWRLFKSRLGATAQGASCFTTDNPNGCAYDFLDMTGSEDTNPSKYLSTSSSCNTLSYNQSTHLYVCTGAHGSGFTQTSFSRSVQITSLPTLSGTDASYNDDLRVVVTVKFKRTNGYTNQVIVVDFLHARA